MIFVDIPFPKRIALGAQIESAWSTTVVPTTGGFEDAVQNWMHKRYMFDVSFAVRRAVHYEAIVAHHDMVRGRARSFPFRNPLTNIVTVLNGTLLTATATAAVTADGTYYLHRRFGSGSSAYDKRITRPDSPIAVYRERASVVTNITGAGAAVTYTTGAVAITGHVAGDTYGWSGTFALPCRYDTDILPAAIIDKKGGDDGEYLVSCDSIKVIEVRE